jgi:hypothetical protein
VRLKYYRSNTGSKLDALYYEELSFKVWTMGARQHQNTEAGVRKVEADQELQSRIILTNGVNSEWFGKCLHQSGTPRVRLGPNEGLVILWRRA